MVDGSLTAGEYELLTRLLVDRLRHQLGVLTTRLEWNVEIAGRATTNQIDVVWEGRLGYELHRIVFECRNYKSAIKQGALHAFRSVVDDIGDQMPTTGVMVTTTGYQKGAKRVAETYGLIVVEMREPTAADTADRVFGYQFAPTMRLPLILDLQPEVIEAYEDLQFSGVAAAISIDWEGQRMDLTDVLLRGETSPLGEPPTPPHSVMRRFDPPAILLVDNQPVARISALGAVVGDSDTTARFTVGPGLENIAWVARDVLGGAIAWFAQDGTVYVVPE